MIDNSKRDYIKEIITDTSKLPDRCNEINILENKDEVDNTIVELKQTLREHKEGVGLAAPQIGKNIRIFIINFNGDMRAFINPLFTHTSDVVLSREGCLSLPGKQYLVPRFNDIKVKYQNPQGNYLESHLIGMAAHILQHELDHLDGISLDAIGLEIDDDFDNASEEDKDKIIQMYLDSLKRREEKLNEEIDDNPELKKMRDGIKFIQKVQSGEITVEQKELTEDEKKQLQDKLKESIDE